MGGSKQTGRVLASSFLFHCQCDLIEFAILLYPGKVSCFVSGNQEMFFSIRSMLVCSGIGEPSLCILCVTV